MAGGGGHLSCVIMAHCVRKPICDSHLKHDVTLMANDKIDNKILCKHIT